MNIDTIVTDMDDTLFNEEGLISNYTLNVLRKCLARGLRVIPASGRTHASMLPFMKQLNTGMPYIGGNGTELINGDHTILETTQFEAPLACEICDFLTQNGCYVQVYRDDCFYYAAECDPAKQYKQSSGMKGVAVGDLSSFLNFPVPKVLSVNHPDEIMRLHPIANRLFEGRATFTQSKPYFLEAMPYGASKGTALLRLAKLIQIDPNKTVVFGDSLNDMSMLAFTKNSVAMGNARDEVKQSTQFVCGLNTKDGLAHFIEKHILSERSNVYDQH
ncbi:MAG: Cof-type HAD-IIB family hydrolase [Clostridia bacterium]